MIVPEPATAASRIDVLVVALERGVRDLERVEHAHLDVIDEVGQRARHPDEAGLPLVAQLDERVDRAVLLERVTRRTDVELHEVEMVGAHPPKALLDGGADVLGREHVGRPLSLDGWRLVHGAPTLAGEEVLVAPLRDVLADELLRHAVIGRRVDEVDPGVEHRVQDLSRGAGVDVAACPIAAAQLHRPVSELRDLEAGAAQRRGGEITHVRLRAFRRRARYRRSCRHSGRYRPYLHPATAAGRGGRRSA